MRMNPALRSARQCSHSSRKSRRPESQGWSPLEPWPKTADEPGAHVGTSMFASVRRPDEPGCGVVMPPLSAVEELRMNPALTFPRRCSHSCGESTGCRIGRSPSVPRSKTADEPGAHVSMPMFAFVRRFDPARLPGGRRAPQRSKTADEPGARIRSLTFTCEQSINLAGGRGSRRPLRPRSKLRMNPAHSSERRRSWTITWSTRFDAAHRCRRPPRPELRMNPAHTSVRRRSHSSGVRGPPRGSLQRAGRAGE
jgi:hypothetical protein